MTSRHENRESQNVRGGEIRTILTVTIGSFDGVSRNRLGSREQPLTPYGAHRHCFLLATAFQQLCGIVDPHHFKRPERQEVPSGLNAILTPVGAITAMVGDQLLLAVCRG